MPEPQVFIGSAAFAERAGVVPGAITNAIKRGTIEPDAWIEYPRGKRAPLFLPSTVARLVAAGAVKPRR